MKEESQEQEATIVNLSIDYYIDRCINYVIENAGTFKNAEELISYYEKEFSKIPQSVWISFVDDKISQSKEEEIKNTEAFDIFIVKCNDGINNKASSMVDKKEEKSTSIETTKEEQKKEKSGLMQKVKSGFKSIKDTFDEGREEAMEFVMKEIFEGVFSKIKPFVPKAQKAAIEYMIGEGDNNERIIILKLNSKKNDVVCSIFKRKNINMELKSCIEGNEGITEEEVEKELQDAFEMEYGASEALELLFKYMSMSDKEKAEMRINLAPKFKK